MKMPHGRSRCPAHFCGTVCLAVCWRLLVRCMVCMRVVVGHGQSVSRHTKGLSHPAMLCSSKLVLLLEFHCKHPHVLSITMLRHIYELRTRYSLCQVSLHVLLVIIIITSVWNCWERINISNESTLKPPALRFVEFRYLETRCCWH